MKNKTIYLPKTNRLFTQLFNESIGDIRAGNTSSINVLDCVLDKLKTLDGVNIIYSYVTKNNEICLQFETENDKTLFILKYL